MQHNLWCQKSVATNRWAKSRLHSLLWPLYKSSRFWQHENKSNREDALETTHEITRRDIHRSATQSWSKLGSLLKDNCNAESGLYARQDGQHKLMPRPVLFQIIVCSMNGGIGHWIIAQSSKWRLEFVEYTRSNSSSYLAWCWIAICSSILTAWVCGSAKKGAFCCWRSIPGCYNHQNIERAW